MSDPRSWPKKLDLCGHCKDLKSVRKLYKVDTDELQNRCRGHCYRCDQWDGDLWPMIELNALERMSTIRG
ncbi:MAG: hypothetical protein AB7L09_02185 [Nitrospira sp.]